MLKIKTRNNTRADIKPSNVLTAGDRMRKSYLRAEEAVRNLTDDSKTTPDEYAEDKSQRTVEALSHGISSLTLYQGRKLAHKGREALQERKRETDWNLWKEASDLQSESSQPNEASESHAAKLSWQERSIHQKMPSVRGKNESQSTSGRGPKSEELFVSRHSADAANRRAQKTLNRAVKRQGSAIEEDTGYALSVKRGRNLAIKQAEKQRWSKQAVESKSNPTQDLNKASSIGEIKVNRTSMQNVSPSNAASRETTKDAAKAIKTAERVSRSATRSARAAVQLTRNSAQASAKAMRTSAQASRATARATVVSAKAAAKATAAAIKAIAAAAKGMISAIAAGGWIAVLTIMIICISGFVAASPFGIFFAGGDRATGSVTVASAVAEVNADFNSKLEALQRGGYDQIDITGDAADWPEILAVFAVKVSGSGTADAIDVATLDHNRVTKLKDVFEDMNVLTSEVETIDHPGSNPGDDGWTERILHININGKTAEEMKMEYRFSSTQEEMLDELLANRNALLELIENLELINADAAELLRNLPDDLSDERREIIKTACSLVGKVNYYWGGKSLVLGWDSRWGELQQVTADDSSTTGTYRPYGLDCSGFVDWVFYNATGGEYIIGHGGGAATQHSSCAPISWDDAQPGDLVFYPNDSHIGIVAGRDEAGGLLIIHCAYGSNNVVISGSEGFTSIGRPLYFTT